MSGIVWTFIGFTCVEKGRTFGDTSGGRSVVVEKGKAVGVGIKSIIG